jgi:hypothetical protein
MAQNIARHLAKISLSLAVLAGALGCEDPSASTGTTVPPTAPSAPTIPGSPPATYTLSGVVTERFSGHPVQGATVWVEPTTESRQVRFWPPSELRHTPSDGAGRYTVSGLPLASYWVSTAQTWGDPFLAPYVHQCVTTVTVENDTTLNVTISSTADLVALNASPGPTPPNSRTVSGTVFENTAHGRQTLKNVWVGYEGSGSGDAFAETRTDAAGHYLLCGLPKERISIGVSPAWAKFFNTRVDPGGDAIVDIDLTGK